MKELSKVKRFCKNKPACMFKAIVLLVLILDIITKTLVVKYKPSGSGFFSLNYATNTGAAFGILEGANVFLILLSIIVLATIIYLIFHYIKKTPQNMIIFSAILFGGTLGNLIDRLIRGHVVDFLDFSFWPAFNIADIGITVGVIGIIYLLYKE